MFFSKYPPDDLTHKYYNCFWIIPVEKFVYAWALLEMLWYGFLLFIVILLGGMHPIILLFVPFIVPAVLMFIGNWRKVWWLFVPELIVWAILFLFWLAIYLFCVAFLIKSLIFGYDSELVWKVLFHGFLRLLATFYCASIGGVLYRGFQYARKIDQQKSKKEIKEIQIV